MLSTTGKQKKLSQLANRLVLDQIIAIPLQAWAPKRQDYNASPILSKEDIINYRLGFIFQAYRVQFWWWESMEMTRKFLMTSLLIFIYPEEPAQLAAGSMITFFFLFINLHFKPYCTDGLNSFQTYALVTQFLTLFVGIMIALQHDRQEVADDESNRVVREITNNVVVLMNAIVVIWPILRQIRYASFDEWWDTLQNWYETCTSPSRKREKSSALVHLATIRAPTSKEDKTTEKNLKVTVEADVIVVNGDHFQSSHGVLEDGVVRERPRRVSSFVTSEPDSLPVPHQAEPTAHSSEKIQESALAADGPAPPHRAKDKPRPDPVRDAPRLVSAHGPGMPMRGE